MVVMMMVMAMMRGRRSRLSIVMTTANLVLTRT